MARSLVTCNPFRGISSLGDEMERLFDNVSGRYPRERVEAVWGLPVGGCCFRAAAWLTPARLNLYSFPDVNTRR